MREFGAPVEEIPAEVLFAGIAPGVVGYYQVSIRLPLRLPGPQMTISCGLRIPAQFDPSVSVPIFDTAFLPVRTETP